MMRTLLSLFFYLMIFGVLPAQPRTDSIIRVSPISLEELNRQADSALTPHQRVYSRARMIGDYESATTALLYLIDNEKGNRVLETELMKLYQLRGMNEAALRLGEQILQNYGPDEGLCATLGYAFQLAGRREDAITQYKNAFQFNPLSYYRYLVAQLEFELGRYQECKANAEALLASENIKSDMIALSDADGIQKELLMEAALFNMLGMIEMQFSKWDAAISWFEKARTAAPQFELPKNNLELAKKRKKGK